MPPATAHCDPPGAGKRKKRPLHTDRAAASCGQWDFFSGFSQCWWQEAQLPPQPSPFQPPCLEIHTTARANSPARTRIVMIPRIVSIDHDLSFCAGMRIFSIHYFAQKSNCPGGRKNFGKFEIGACQAPRNVI